MVIWSTLAKSPSRAENMICDFFGKIEIHKKIYLQTKFHVQIQARQVIGVQRNEQVRAQGSCGAREKSCYAEISWHLRRCTLI
jgi:hypothetical protein